VLHAARIRSETIAMIKIERFISSSFKDQAVVDLFFRRNALLKVPANAQVVYPSETFCGLFPLV
jgi:hypothetical protein